MQDGVRFKTLSELVKHTDACLTKKDVQRKRDLSGEKVYRNWYSTAAQWVSDYNSLGVVAEPADKTGKGATGQTQQSDEVFIVPADEHFTRCPVSKEVFETLWDADEGELMFRNAAKVLVTQSADPILFAISAKTAEPSIGYTIVHKLLVLDAWLEQGRADTLLKTKTRYEELGRRDLAAALLRAAGTDESEEDVFVLLEQ